MKNKNNLFLILGVALVAVILGSVITASVTGFALRDVFMPGPKLSDSQVRANSCDADSSCEVNKIVGKDGKILQINSGRDGTLILGSTKDIRVNGNLRVYGFDITAASGNFGRLFFKDENVGFNNAATIVIAGDYDKINRVQKPVELVIKTSELEDGLFSPFTVRVVGNLLVTSLGRSNANEPSNAFACFDAAGKLYRSSTPCN